MKARKDLNFVDKVKVYTNGISFFGVVRYSWIDRYVVCKYDPRMGYVEVSGFFYTRKAYAAEELRHLAKRMNYKEYRPE